MIIINKFNQKLPKKCSIIIWSIIQKIFRNMNFLHSCKMKLKEM